MGDLGFRLSSFVGCYEGFISFFFMMMAFTTVGLFMGQGFLRSASVLYRTYRTITLRLKIAQQPHIVWFLRPNTLKSEALDRA